MPFFPPVINRMYPFMILSVSGFWRHVIHASFLFCDINGSRKQDSCDRSPLMCPYFLFVKMKTFRIRTVNMNRMPDTSLRPLLCH